MADARHFLEYEPERAIIDFEKNADTQVFLVHGLPREPDKPDAPATEVISPAVAQGSAAASLKGLKFVKDLLKEDKWQHRVDVLADTVEAAMTWELTPDKEEIKTIYETKVLEATDDMEKYADADGDKPKLNI